MRDFLAPYSGNNVSYYNKNGQWVAKQYLGDIRITGCCSLEELVEYAQKEKKYYEEEYLSGPTKTSCDSIAPNLNFKTCNDARRISHPPFTATFTSIELENRCDREGNYNGTSYVFGWREVAEEELKAIEAKEKEKETAKSIQEKREYEQLRKRFDELKEKYEGEVNECGSN